MAPEVILLGPVSFGLPPEAPGGPKPSAVLALLALSVGSSVSNTELINGVWDDDPPDSADATLQAYISRLRKLCSVRGNRIERVNRGYRLDAAPASIDVNHLADQIAIAERTPSATSRASILDAAMCHLGDEPLAGCAETTSIAAARQRLNALQLTMISLCATTAMTTDLDLPSAAFRIADRNPGAESTQAALCAMLLHRGRPEEARQRLDWVADYVHTILETEPSPAITSLTGKLANGGRTTPTTNRSGQPLPAVHGGDQVGRTRERGLLRRAVIEDQPGVVLVTGAGGMGKTSLVRNAIPTALWAPGPVIGDTPWPWVWPLLDVDPPFVPTGTPLYETLEMSTQAIIDQVSSTPRPIVLVVDDLHARSRVSRLQFAALARRLPPKGVSLVGISRDRSPVPSADRFTNEVAFTQIDLEPLSTREAMAILQTGEPIDDVLAGGLVSSAGGSPLLLKEGLRAIAGRSLERDVLTGRINAAPVASRRVLDLVALSGAASVAAITETLGPKTGDRLQSLIADGLIEVRGDEVAFTHDRLAEAAREIPADDHQMSVRARFGDRLIASWDGQPGSAVALAPILRAASLPCAAVHAAAADAHHLARDWRSAAVSTELALNDEGQPARMTELTRLAAERWTRAGDLWRARELLAPTIDQLLDAHHSFPPLREPELNTVVEYITYGTTGFRMDDRIRRVLELEATGSADSRVGIMLDAVRLTEARRQSIRLDPSSIDASDLLHRARALGDPRAIAWALGPSLVDALNSDAHRELRQLADELEANASGAEQSEVPVVAGWYRFEAANRRGDRGALERELSAIEARAVTTMEVPNRWYAHTLRAGRMLAEGDLENAEHHLDIALDLGTTSIGSEAMASYGAGLLFVRWFQDRSTELLGVAPAPARGDRPLGAPVLGSIMGALIRALLPSAPATTELADVAPLATSTLELALVGEAAIATGNRTVAESVLARLRPDTPMVAMPAGCYLSAAESLRGRLLALVDQPEAATAALARGHGVEVGAGAILWSHRTALAQAALMIDGGDRSAGLRHAADTEHWARMNHVHALERKALELRTRASLT